MWVFCWSVMRVCKGVGVFEVGWLVVGASISSAIENADEDEGVGVDEWRGVVYFGSSVVLGCFSFFKACFFVVGGMGSCFRVIRACWIISCFVRFFEASMCCACDSNSGVSSGWFFIMLMMVFLCCSSCLVLSSPDILFLGRT